MSISTFASSFVSRTAANLAASISSVPRSISSGSIFPPGNTHRPAANFSALFLFNYKTSMPSTVSLASMMVAAGFTIAMVIISSV